MKERLFRFRARIHALLAKWLGMDLAILIFGALVGAAAGVATASFGTLVERTARLAWGFESGRAWLAALLVVLVPAGGGLLVGLIQNHLAKTGPTHGIPEVVTALVKKHGMIPAKAGAWKALTASITLGTGGCAGMEGPVVTIGSAAGSAVGRVIGVKPGDLPVLVGCGAAAAVAAAFSAPIAGVLFVLEVILCDFSPRMFMPIVVASVVGMVAGQGFTDAMGWHAHGHGALFMADSLEAFRPTVAEMPAYALLGLACGALGFLLTACERRGEKLWKKVPGPAWLRPGLGGLALGLSGLAFGFLLPHGGGVFRELSGQNLPAFMGNGYGVIGSLFHPDNFAVGGYTAGLLLAVLAFKVLGVGLTLGSGGSGGAIAPSLFVGAAAGGAVGCLAKATGFFPDATPATYAVVGMGGVIAGAFRCPLTAFVLVFELTHDYAMVWPAMLVAILATVAARRLGRDSLITLQLREKGVRMGHGVSILRRTTVAGIPLEPAHFVGEHEDAARVLELAAQTHADDFVAVGADGAMRGVVYSETLRELLLDQGALPLLLVGDLMRSDLPALSPEETLEEVLDKFTASKARSLPVLGAGGKVLGLMTRGKLTAHYHEVMAGE